MAKVIYSYRRPLKQVITLKINWHLVFYYKMIPVPLEFYISGFQDRSSQPLETEEDPLRPQKGVNDGIIRELFIHGKTKQKIKKFGLKQKYFWNL